METGARVRSERRLAAAADVVGYSRIIGADEGAILDRHSVHKDRGARKGPTMRRRLRTAISLMLLTVAGVAQAGSEDEVKALFTKFVAAQNAHDLKAVGELLQDSPNFLWVTRGAPVWGRDAALKRFGALYQGTWSLDPKSEELKVIELQPGVAQLYVPITFMIAQAGQTAQPMRFLMYQVLVKTTNGWKVSSILPVPAPQQ